MLWGSSLLLFAMKLNCYLLLVFLMLLTYSISAQEKAPLRQFYTQKVQARIEANPAVQEARSAIEREVEEAKRSKQFKKLIVPVVFHVLYSGAAAYPNNDQVASQLTALNRDFASSDYSSKKLEGGTDVTAYVADTEITFCVPQKDPNGKKTTGINYVATDTVTWGDSDGMKSELTGGTGPWDPDRYLNVWVVRLADSISGWAQMPGGPRGTDGIVLDYRFFGTEGTAAAPYNEGKTLTHLIGNYLNLFDLWNEGNLCGDDYVADTPIHNGPNNHCIVNETHVSMCNDNPVEMTVNFMDNTPDACMYMFTLGQKQRMQATLLEGGARAGLVEGEVQCGKAPKGSTPSQNVVANVPATATQAVETEWPDSLESATVTVFPNPATAEAHLIITVQEATRVRTVVYDVLGKIVQHGEAIIEAGEQRIKLDVTNWPTGAYYTHVQVGDKQFTERLVVQARAISSTRQ